MRHQKDVNVADAILLGGTLYVTVGVLFAALFVFRTVARVDPATADAPLGFRLIILPGAIALWPVLLRKTLLARRGDT